MAELILSAFDVIGPVMIGPSSSHTAGAARLGAATRALLGATPATALIEMHGSFAATGRGHASDRAVVAGLLGCAPDDPALPNALANAPAAGLIVRFATVDLGLDAHPNSLRITLAGATGTAAVRMTGASLGGGVVAVTEIDGYATDFRVNADTLVIWHEDRTGFLARVTSVLACAEVNIATLRTSRRERGADALTVVETDGPPPAAVLDVLRLGRAVRRLRHLSPLP